MKYTVILNNQTYLENVTIEQFLDYIEDTDEFLGWTAANNYEPCYGRKVMEHFLYTYDRCINQYLTGFTYAGYEFYPEEE